MIKLRTLDSVPQVTFQHLSRPVAALQKPLAGPATADSRCNLLQGCRCCYDLLMLLLLLLLPSNGHGICMQHNY